jgi:hypothetical protein
MKYSILSFFILSLTTACFGGEPTSVEPTANVGIVENTGTNVVCSDCNIRRRNIVRNGYVLTNHELTTNSISTTRSVIDNKNNIVRSRTVTKNFCNNGKCKTLVK